MDGGGSSGFRSSPARSVRAAALAVRVIVGGDGAALLLPGAPEDAWAAARLTFSRGGLVPPRSAQPRSPARQVNAGSVRRRSAPASVS